MASTCLVRLQLHTHLAPLTESVSSDDQVKAYIKKIMSQLNKWMAGGKISKLVVVITSKETGEHVERWQFDVGILPCRPLQQLTSLGPNIRKAQQEQIVSKKRRQGKRGSRVSHSHPFISTLH